MSQLSPFVRQSGFDVIFLATICESGPSMFAFDLLVSCLVFWTFVFMKGRCGTGCTSP
jgi:hypothetical protein